jgi:potassium-transporting ATPase KdpC subunit
MMNNILKPIRPTIVLLLGFTVLFGGIYPAIVTGLSQMVFIDKANGSLIERDGQAVGSELIGQSFTQAKYFWGRLSATGPVPYNAEASGGSNYGNANPALVEAVKARMDALKEAEPENTQPVPVDLVTASGSGLDPHISLAAAQYQMSRVAKARGLDIKKVSEIVDKYAQKRMLGILGEPTVNVLQVNLALDELSP